MAKYMLFAEDGKHELSITEKTEAIPRKYLSNVHKILDEELAPIAFDNNYDLLYNKPRIPSYSAGTGLSLSGTTFNHKNSVTAGTARGDASKTLTFGGTFTIPTITYDAQGHITGKGTTTMTMPANPNTAGSSNTSSKIFLVGATSQTPNATTYSHDTTYIDDDEVLVSSAFTAGTNHIIAPKGGQYSYTSTSTVKGYLKITLPVSSNDATVRFYVDIYNYQTDTMVTYMIGGYKHENSSWVNTSAVAYGRKGSKLSNLDVHFGNDGSKCAIYIGSADTTWNYPQVMVRDILVGFGHSALGLDSGWSIGFTTTLGTISTTVYNPYIGYNAYTADNVAWSGITNKPSYYDAKAIKSIIRYGTTFTATHLDGTTSTFTQQDNNTVYSHPAGSAASKSSGLYKFSTDSTSHISSVTDVTKADITALGIPAHDTTYDSMSVDEGTSGTATTNRVLTASNLKDIINAHAPTKTGGGASGTWGISISGNAASASKVNNKLTVGSKSYDGSAAVTIEASDLGLASAMLFLGTTTTAITDGAKTNPVAISGSNKTVTAGNVVLYGSKEFVWTGSAWEELGNEGSYKIVQAAVADPSASGTSNTFIATISQDANGKITATKKTVAVTNSAPTLAWGTTSTIGTVAGTNLQVKMPANPNTDTKVTQTVTTSNAAYPLLLAPSGQTATTTTTSYFDSGVTLNPSTNTIAANVSGNAATATKLATARTISLIGSVTGSGTFDGSGNLSITTTTNHTHTAATTSANGFMSSSDKSKLDGIATGANKYSHPTYTSRASGLYKITVDGTGHVSAAASVTKSDITALGIPSTNTTYSVATTSSNGLMSSSDKTKLNKANINVYKMSNIDTVATGSSDYVDIGFCSGYNTSFGGTYICISISWQGYAIQFRMGQGASTVKTRCTNTSKQWTAWH